MMRFINTWQVLLAFAAIYFIWGSTYIAILLGLKDLPPFLLSAIRFLLAGVLLLGWCYHKKQPLPSLSSIRDNAVCGTLMLFVGTGSVVWAEQYIASSLAAIVVTTVPFWFIILDRRQRTYYFSNKLIIAGLVLGFAGILVLTGFGHAGQKNPATDGQQMAGLLGIIAGGIAWTTGSLKAKYRSTGNNLLMNGSIQLLTAGLFSLLVSMASGEAQRVVFSRVTATGWLAVLYLTIMGSLVAYLCYNYLLKIRTPAEVSTYVYVNPVVALLLGAMIMHEQISGLQVLALVIILSGVLLVNLQKYKTLFAKISE